jgi:hypothetical protein
LVEPADASKVRRLKTGQKVTLDVSGAADTLDCAVLSVDGSRATLLDIDRSQPGLRATLATGALAFLIFRHGSAQIALRGLAWASVPAGDAFQPDESGSLTEDTSPSGPATRETEWREDAAEQSSAEHEPPPPVLIFQVTDGVEVQNRRQFARIPLIVAVQASSPDGSSLGVSVTSDLSLGGVKLARRPALGEGPSWRLQLTLPGDPNPIDCEADLVRSTATHLSLRFSQMAESDRARLAAAISAWEMRIVHARTTA